MENEKNIKITISLTEAKGQVRLAVENDTPNCYTIQSNNLMLDGEVKANNFRIVEKSSGHKLAYQGIMAKSLPEYIQLDSGQTLESSSINLEGQYDFITGEHYDLCYKSYLIYSPCVPNLEQSLLGNFVESNHVEFYY